MPLQGPGSVRLRDITHSSMNVLWDAAAGNVLKYIVKYKTNEEEDYKEVRINYMSMIHIVFHILNTTSLSLVTYFTSIY